MSTPESIFISGNYNINYKLGVLSSLKDNYKNIKYWYCSGASSFIVFLKCLGYDYKTSLEKLKELDLNCFSDKLRLFNVEEDEIIIFEKLGEWIKNCFKNSKLFNSKMTLNEIFKKTGIKAKFIVWNDTLKKIDILDDKNKLVECLLASLPSYGSYQYYEIDGIKYTSLEILNPYPYFQVKHKPCIYILDEIMETRKNDWNDIYDRYTKYQLDNHSNKLKIIYSSLPENTRIHDVVINLKCVLNLSDIRHEDEFENGSSQFY